jgi:hypothetical protein
MNNNKMVWTGVSLMVLAVVLASRPTCNRGCQTLAEHLIEHGLSDMVGALLG